MSLDQTQEGVARGMAIAVVVAIGVFASVYLLHWPDLSEHADITSRLKLTAFACLVPTTMLLLCIARLAKHRFSTPQDIGGSGLTNGTERARLLQSLLQNTLEQTAIALPIYFAAALIFSVKLLPLLIAAAFLFAIGRLLFFQGYASGAPSRAVGFGLTFYSSLVLLVVVIAVAGL
jgi:hypothetical protein